MLTKEERMCASSQGPKKTVNTMEQIAQGGLNPTSPPPPVSQDFKVFVNAMVGAHPSDYNAFRTAFNHRSTSATDNNERNEWIGDAVLNLIASDWLYRRYPHANEGVLTKARAKLVMGTTLARYADFLSIQDHIQTAKGRGAVVSQKMREDCFEALLGAIYLDPNLGLEHAYPFCSSLFSYFFDDVSLCQESNYKDIVAKVQRIWKLPLNYSTCSECTEAAGKSYMCEVTLGKFRGRNRANSKKEAEQKAAHSILANILHNYPYLSSELFLNETQIRAYR